MPEHRVTRDAFDALVLDKVRKYNLTKDEAIRETLRELQLHAPSRSVPRMERYEGDLRDIERYLRSSRGEFPGPSTRELEDEVSASLHFVFPDRRRSRSPPIGEQLYFKGDFAGPELRGREFNSAAIDSAWLREQELLLSRRRDHSPLRAQERDFEGGRRVEAFRGIMSPDYESVRQKIRAQAAQAHEGSFAQLGPARDEEAWNVREPKIDVDDTDVFSKVGSQLIHWAEFDKVKHSSDFHQQHSALFLAETEACAKTLASFKCSLKPEHRDFCFSMVRELKHPALKSPKVDNDLLNLLVNKNAVQTKNDFFELIKPFDRSMMSIQESLLKSVVPLLMACNTFELKKGFDPAELPAALENTISLCRKSLVLFGQTYSLATWLRQERILETIGLRGKVAKPSGFPNLDDSFLFGKEYMSHLKSYLENSGTPFRMKSNTNSSEKKKGDLQIKSEPEDSDVFQTIDGLLENAMDSRRSRPADKKTKRPPFWFLFAEKSKEYKYYQKKLAELRKVKKFTKESEMQTEKTKTPEDLATESMRAIRYARKALEVKRKLARGLAESRRRKVKRWNIGTQTVLSASLMLKLKAKQRKSGDKKSTSDSVSSKSRTPKTETTDAESLGVDAATKDTAEKLAQFVAQMGPEIEKFSMENSESNPEFWFLHAKNSPAYKYYQLKITEFRRAMGIPDDYFERLALEEAAKAQALAEASKVTETESKDQEPEKNASGPGASKRLSPESKSSPRTASETQDQKPEVPGTSVLAKQPFQLLEQMAAVLPQAAFGEWQQSMALTDVSQATSTTSVPAPASASLPRKRVGALKVGMLPSKRVCLVEDLKVHDPVRIAYERPQGRTNKKKVPKPKDLVYEDKKITDVNVGFKMLQKMGWQEGQGLGTVGAGIKEPVKVGSITGGEGLGVEEPKEDSFESFRQRMIQMYRDKIVNS